MTITTEQLDNLRGLIKFALPLPWKWWTSNSNTRLTSAVGKDGDVIHAVKAVDGHTCVNISSDNMNLITSAVNALPELLAHIDAQAARIASMDSMLIESVEALRLSEKELAALRDKMALSMGVGDGNGQLLVHGDYDSIKAAQRIVLRLHEAEKELAALRESATPVAVPDKVSCEGFDPKDWNDARDLGQCEGFNSCIDEVLRLNSGSKPE